MDQNASDTVRMSEIGVDVTAPDQFGETVSATSLARKNHYAIGGSPSRPDSQIRIFGIDVLNVTMHRALDILDEVVARREQAKAYFVNADCLNLACVNQHYRNIVQRTPYVFGDGTGVRWASRWVGTPIVDNVNGTDMLPLLCERAIQKEHRLYLLGGQEGVAQAMAVNLRQRHPGLTVVGTHHGYFCKQKPEISHQIVDSINRARPDVLLVALGAPHQELWIDAQRPRLDCPIAMGVGGLFDFYSGRLPRAPLWFRRLGSEWVFRLMQEPRRLAQRYLLGNPVFLWRTLRYGSRAPS